MKGIEKQVEYLEMDIEDRIKSNMSSTEKGYQFLMWVLDTMFSKVETEIDDDFDNGDVIILDGKDDGGIDACFIENNELYALQTKYNLSHGPESTSYFIEQMKQLFMENKDVSKRTNEVIQKIKDKGIININLFYVTNGTESLNSDTTTCFDNSDFYIKYQALGISDIVSFLDERYAPIPYQIKKDFKVLVEKYFISKEKETIVAEVSLKEIAKLVWNGKDYLYHSNIRNHLGNNKVNKSIENTLEHPKNFWYYNNGITIVCDTFDCKTDHFINGGAQVIINTPQIVNGCQTTKTLFNYMYPKNKKRENYENQEGTILVKIIKDTNNKRKEITRYTNSQTAVTGKDFYALEEYQHKLKVRFCELGYNYEIQTKAYSGKEYKGNIEYDYLFDDNFTKRHVKVHTISKKMGNKINVNDSTQAYVAGFLSRPAKAKTKSNYAPGTNLYEKIYNDVYSPEDARYFFFPYAIMYYYKKSKNRTNNKNCSLFFCDVYFKLLLKIFKEKRMISIEANNFIENTTITKQKENIEIIDKIVKNIELNKKILYICEDIVIDFLDDGKISELIGDNLPKFLKSGIETSLESIEVLKKQIDKQLNRKTDILNDPTLMNIFSNE